MKVFGGQSTVCCNLSRKAKLLAATLAMSAVLTACGGGDDSPVAAATPTRPGGTATSPTTPGAAPTTPGGVVADSGSSSNSGGVSKEDEVVPPASEEEGVASGDGSVTLSWIPPTSNDDGSPLKLTGYRIYWGPSDDQFTHSILVENPGLTRYVVEQLSAGTWYFVATALSGDRESEYSNVFKATVK